ncbi:MAG TPA: amidohydrolase family protein [Candidatus Binatia bacterium]|jgi:predicted TIM-barrel fold metal-dependent hydrolase
MSGVVDADTHIAESEAMWSHIDNAMLPRRPVLVKIPDDTWYKERNAFWLIDGEIFPKPAGKASFSLITPSAQKKESGRGDIHLAVRELTDPAARLKDMDKIGVEIQVIYPTLFLVYLTDDAKLETALCRAYNRFVAKRCGEAPDRLKWVALLPLRDRGASLAEMKWAKEQGAVGVFFRGMEGNLTLDNPYFFPVYAEAERLDLPICIHTGSGSRYLMQLFDLERNHTFAHNRVLPVVAFRDLVANRIPEQFPKLRFGFIEAAASWVPYIIHVLRRSVRPDLKQKNPQDLFSHYRFWIACEADEELPHLLNYIGEDHIVIGSDYGHNDPSKEPEFVKNMRSREDVAPAVIEKILCQNPRALYGLN